MNRPTCTLTSRTARASEVAQYDAAALGVPSAAGLQTTGAAQNGGRISLLTETDEHRRDQTEVFEEPTSRTAHQYNPVRPTERLAYVLSVVTFSD